MLTVFTFFFISHFIWKQGQEDTFKRAWIKNPRRKSEEDMLADISPPHLQNKIKAIVNFN